jgi:hypothetical protein
MAVLEYLTANSLTAYPFKALAATNVANSNPIQQDWFYDILFVSYADTIRSVYISNIAKTLEGSLILTLNNTETGNTISPNVVISPDSVVNHRANTNQSFAYFSASSFSIKLVFGAGITSIAPGFTQSYIPSESTLSSGAVVMKSPKLRSLTLSSYTSDVDLTGKIIQYATPIKRFYYNSPSDFSPTARIRPRANSAFRSTGESSGDLWVLRGAGTGLYDPCAVPEEGITDLFTINNIKPNSTGGLYLNLSGCYTADVLTDNSITLYNSLAPGNNPLTPYKSFVVHTATGTSTFNATTANNSIIVENFCTPRCAPENLAAFAHYLNRVSDGALELNKIAAQKLETRGKGTASGLTFTAASFCLPGNPFSRGSSSSVDLNYIQCGEKFIKNYHEGRQIQLHYDNNTVRTHTIVSCLSDSSVLLDTAPAATGTGVWFRVLDTGAVGNMNVAIADYNLLSSSFLSPYFQVKYTTSEGYTSGGAYVTFLAIVVAVYNPSKALTKVKAIFASGNFTQQGVFKIRTAEGITQSTLPEANVGCNQYAFIEAVYFIACGVSGQTFTISVDDVTTNPNKPIGVPYELPGVNGVSCPDPTGSSKLFRAYQGRPFPYTQSPSTPTAQLTLSTGTTQYTLNGSVPAWFNTNATYDAVSYTLTLSSLYNPTDTNNGRYSLYYKCVNGAVPGSIYQFIIDYVALPSITSPLGTTYTNNNPLQITKTSTYTSAVPIFQANATNMAKLSADFPTEDNASFKYSLAVEGGQLPAELSFDQNTGKLTGTLDPSVPIGSLYHLVISAANPAGQATNPQDIYLLVQQTARPVVTLSKTSPVAADNVTTYTNSVPLITCSSADGPIFGYTLTVESGTFPPGLSFSSTTGKITGKITASSPGYASCSVYATNPAGRSESAEPFTINYVAYSVPTITFPTAGAQISTGFTTTTTSTNPLFAVTANTVSSLQNTYTCVSNNIPAGFTLNATTGKFYGTLDSSLIPTSQTTVSTTYSIRLAASNAAGSSYVDISLIFSRSVAPTINNLISGGSKQVIKSQAYTAISPFLKIEASSSPTSYTCTGTLPTGLVFDSGTGLLTGTVSDLVPAGPYVVSFSATNAAGTSPLVSHTLNVPIAITAPSNNSSYTLVTGTNYPSLFTVTTSGLLAGAGAVTVTTSGLPTGLTGTSPVQGTPTVASVYAVSITATTVNYGSHTRTVGLTVNPAVTSYNVSGKISDSTGAGVAGISVFAYSGKSTTTDSNGNYTLASVPVGTYNIYPSLAGKTITPAYTAVTVTNTNITGINFTSA